jgi:hypothetical protein
MIVFELDAQGKPILSNPVEIKDDAEIPANHVKLDSITSYTETGDVFAESLDTVKVEKIAELYNAYQAELNGQVTSSVIGADGLNIVFPYTDKDRNNYQSIGVKFSLNPDLTQSIIGSDSHGKFFIQRADFVTLTGDFDNHETSLYMKFADKRSQVESILDSATAKDDVRAIVW